MTFTEENRQELEENGYTVIPDVLTAADCQHYIGQYQHWLATNFAEGEFPLTSHSLIQRYAVGHLEPSWQVRLKARDVFAQLWGTDRLLSSMDAIAIGRPPEEGEEEFHREDTGGWLHLDQTARRQGLHAYQGAVYLQTADEDDWTFEVVEKSHSLFDEFYNTNSEHQKRALVRGHAKTRDEHLDWMKARGCVQRRVPVPAGAMVLWDSRLIHANARPKKNRRHPDRWRWVVFVCMTPACWATQTALALKRQAYASLQMTTHWPCDDVGFMPTSLPSYAARELHPLDALPEVAQSVLAKRLVGVTKYPAPKSAEEGAREQSLLQRRPQWHPDFLPDGLGEGQKVSMWSGRGRWLAAGVGAVLTGLLVAAVARGMEDML